MGPRFTNKVALVTGGASGIGAATVEVFVAEGARVLIGDLNAELGQAMVAKHGADKVAFQQVDVTDRAAVEALVQRCVDTFGRIDILFNNAGIGAGLATTPDLDPAVWEQVVAVNLHAVFYACRAAIPHMRSQGGGAIVNTASISGMGGDYGFTAYNAAKAGCINYTRSLAIDHAREGIRVNALCPGLIATPLTAGIKDMQGLEPLWHDNIPMGRPGSPSEMANVVAFLASDAASYVTGCILAADGGVTAHTGQPNLLRLMAE
ncbi:SDR family NAD(P)-dependent oxidoreductase [Zavarzinia sp. CC-PAN008]|uniref:SDR family NAD(P)-dependent oxidoreductase n=1 Tax=Zavarzinia sp. CC-PAN008 TaxID=3243332 RepID=UPI003F7424C3